MAENKELVSMIDSIFKEIQSSFTCPIHKDSDSYDTSSEQFTVEGFSDVDDMIHFLDEHGDDLQVLIANIRASKIEFSPYQKELIKELEREYGLYCSNYDTFESAVSEGIVIELREDLIHRETLDPEYCEEQRNFYNCVYHALERSSFPYSIRQQQLLKEIKEGLKWASGNLSDMRDIWMLDQVQEFLKLMKNKDYVNNTKFYINCAIEYHVQEIVDELYYPALNEANLKIPEDFLDEPTVRLATYVINELKSRYRGVNYKTYENIFHLGMSEIYNRIIDIFKYSGLSFSIHQRELLTGILGDIARTAQSPTVKNYADVQLGFYGFLDELRRNHQERELERMDGCWILQKEGHVTTAIAKITKELDDVQEAAEVHHKNFEEYSSSIPDITKSLLHHFLCLYPMEVKESITVDLGKRFRAPALYENGNIRARKY